MSLGIRENWTVVDKNNDIEGKEQKEKSVRIGDGWVKEGRSVKICLTSIWKIMFMSKTEMWLQGQLIILL